MKLNKHLKEFEKEKKATKRVYKIMGVSDEFVPNLEALIKNDARIKNAFNQLLEFQLNHKNDLKIARLKFWGPILGWATLALSTFTGVGCSQYLANVFPSDKLENIFLVGLLGTLVSTMALALSVRGLEEELNRAKSESEKMDGIVDEINGVLAQAIMNNAPSIQPSVNTSSF